MGYRPRTQAEFIERLQHIHHTIMSSRPDKGPGKFRRVKNRAGSTEFVAPELVIGTLRRGFELSQSITTPFARAVFTMFLISEVHPFLDGNGRAARACMNVELVAAGETRIIVPTVYRLDYIGGLKALTHNGRPDALVRVLDFAQRYTGSIDWSSLDRSRKALEVTNAFRDPHEAESLGIHLRIYDGFQ
jgi:Fic family protein